MSAQDSHEIGIIKIMLTKGTDGRGIEKIEKTSTSGIYDTYTITYDDGSKTTYTITNGNGIASIEKTGTSGLVDTYTITFDNGMVETFDVTNGDYISNIAKTGTSGAVDTYTITMASGTTYTFTVVNGDGSLATDIIFDDTTAQLSASTAQGAIDALAKPTFTEASSRANIASGEKLSTILGKIKKFFTDLKTVAFSGSYNDLSDKPTIDYGHVTVTADGTKTYEQLLNSLYTSVDMSKVRAQSIIEEKYNSYIYTYIPSYIASTYMLFTRVMATNTPNWYFDISDFYLKSSGSKKEEIEFLSSVNYINRSSEKPTSGTTITLYY